MNFLTQSRLQHTEGFTLIELLVVMGIIGILAGLLFTNFSSARERARDARRKSDLTQMKNALRLYFNDFGKYPATGLANKIKGCGSVTYGSQTECAWNASFSDGSTVYMNSLANDPLYDATNNPGVTYIYSMGNNANPNDTDHFILRAYLENASDPGIASSQLQCGVVGAPTAKLYMSCD